MPAVDLAAVLGSVRGSVDSIRVVASSSVARWPAAPPSSPIRSSAAARHGARRDDADRVYGAADGPRTAARFNRWHGELDSCVERSGIPAALLRPTFFTQNLLNSAQSIRSESPASGPAPEPTGCALIANHAIITVDAGTRRARQRFSAGHELGHWMYDRGRIAQACTEGNLMRDWHEGSRERRANRYAAELLLPARMFTPRARDLP